MEKVEKEYNQAEETVSPAPGEFRFRKGERLHHKAFVSRLFALGKSEYAYPLRMIYLVESAALKASAVKSRHVEGSSPEEVLRLMRTDRVQFMVTVPKKKQHKAVDRVLLRRRIREAWRLNRNPLRRLLASAPEPLTLTVAVNYVSSEIKPYSKIEEKMRKLLDSLSEKVDEAMQTRPKSDDKES